jgi:SAM-dependent methyltransferase
MENEYGGRLKYFGEEASSEFWDQAWAQAPDRINFQREEQGHLPHALKSAFIGHIKPGARVLEAGSGLGRFTIAMKARGYDAVGVDYAPEVVTRNSATGASTPSTRLVSANTLRADQSRYSGRHSVCCPRADCSSIPVPVSILCDV